jgi:hypothetical protein
MEQVGIVTSKKEFKERLVKARASCLATHYVAAVECTNCESSTIFQIPRGITVLGWLKTLDCPYCGCSMGEMFE